VAKAYSRRNGEFLVNTQTANAQQGPRMAALADGGFIVVWTDGSLVGGDASGVAVKAQRFDASGSQVGGEFLVNTTTSGNQSSPAVAALPSGRFVITWTDASATGGDTSGNAVRGQLFEANGTAVGGEFLVNTAVAGNQGPAVITELPNGGFVIAWTDASGQGGDTSSTGIKAQIFDGNGAKVGGEILANTTTLGSQFGPSVTSLASGGFAIAWIDSAGAYFQRFDAGGAHVGSEQLANASSSFVTGVAFVSGITIASVGSGFVVTWGQADSPPVAGQPITFDIREQRFDASGNKIGAEAIVNTTVEGSQSNPDVHALPDGGYLVTWQGPGDGTSGINVYGQAFDASGARLGSEFLLGTTLDGSQTGGKVTALASGDIVLAWTDSSGLGGDASSAAVKAQLLTVTTDAPTDIALSNALVSETSVENLPVATLSSSSGAVFNAFSYTIVSDSSGGAFGIDGDQLVVVDSSRLDFETQPNLNVTIRATDLNGGTYDESFALTVTDAAIEARYSAGDEFGISDDTAGFNTPLAVVPLASGGFLSVTWDFAIGVSDKIHGRIFDAAGSPVTGEFELAIPNGSFGDAAELPGGGFVLTYRGASIDLGGGSNGFPIRAQLYDAAGHTVGAELLVSTTNNGILGDPSVATLASGGFVVTWTLPTDEGDDPGAAFPSQIRGQIFAASGSPVGGEFRANSTTVGAQNLSHVEALPGGGFVVTWHDFTLQAVEGQIFDAAGGKIGGEFTAVANLPDPVSSQLTVLASGNFLVTWSELIDDSGSVPIYAVEGQLLSLGGAAIGGPLDLAIGTNSSFNIAAAPGGGFALGWSAISLATLDANDNDAWVRIFNNAGAPVGDPFLIASTKDNDSIAAVTALDSGAFAFLVGRGFEENFSSTSDAFARILSPAGPVPPITGTADDDVLADTALADQINGLGGNDMITVHSGHDRVDGGADSDTLVVDYSGATAAVTVSGIQTGTGGGAGWQGHVSDVSAGGGHDVLFDNIERLDLTTGSGDDFVVGIGGVNIIHTGLGDDQLSGGAGNDVLDGGVGADHMFGSQGNDIFYVDDAGDVVTENNGEGTGDEVRTTLSTYVIPDNVEILTGIGTGFQTLRGNAGNNVIATGSGGGLVDFSAGGSDTGNGAGGVDVFYFGAALDQTDQANGGAGKDVVAIQGDYSGGVTLGVHALDNVETLSILGHSDNRFGGNTVGANNYVITSVDANVAAGQFLTINASSLEAGENFTFNGSAETNGSFFIYGGKGADHLTGGSGVDVFFFAEEGRFGAGDQVNGGGGNDILVLRGNYTIDMATSSVTNIETVTLMSGSDSRFFATTSNFNYDIKTAENTVAPGVTMTFNGGGLHAGETLHFDGSAESDGGAFRVFGGDDNDIITGGAGNDLLYGGLGADILTGGAGGDTYLYKSASESTSIHFDTIQGFDYTQDRIDLPFAVSGFADNQSSGKLDAATFDADIAAAVDGGLNPFGAIEFTAGTGDMAGHFFIIVDADGDGAYQAGHDYVINISDAVLPPTPTIFV
jgi:Ca2+-binding RTX toxin-like protein